MRDPKEQFFLFRIRAFKDQAAFRQILKEYGSALQRFLKQKLPTHEDGEDAYNVVCIRLWNYLTDSKVDHLSGLIYTIARSVIADHYRDKKFDTVSMTNSEDGSSIPAISKQSDKQIEAEIDIKFASEMLKQLKEEYQLVISLKHFEGLSIREIAKRLDKTGNATRIILHRALKEFRSLLDK